MSVLPCDRATREAADAFLAERGAARVARRGDLIDATAHAALLALPAESAPQARSILGVLTYLPSPGWSSCEILTLHAARQWHATGSRLLDGLVELAAGHRCERLWLVTTNDNVDALRFCQRRGFRLTAVRPGAVDAARARVKPEIPVVGDHGIPLRDEMELTRDLARKG